MTWYYSKAPECRVGLMVCTACSKPISTGQFRWRSTPKAYLPQHRACSEVDPQWAVLDKAMSPPLEEKKVKLAKALGWVKQPYSGSYWSEMYVKDWDDTGYPLRVLSEDELPDYFNDLNACCDALMTLTGEQMELYATNLKSVVKPPLSTPNFKQVWWLNSMRPLPAQCAEALGLTLNLWD